MKVQKLNRRQARWALYLSRFNFTLKHVQEIKMKKAEVMVLRGEEWQIEKDLVLKEKKIYVPKNEELRAETIQLHHDKLVAGHGGRWKTT